MVLLAVCSLPMQPLPTVVRRSERSMGASPCSAARCPRMQSFISVSSSALVNCPSPPWLEIDSVFSFFNLQFLVGKFHLKLLHSFFPTFVTFPFCPRPAPVTGSHHSIPFCCPPDGDRDLNRIEIFPASLTCCRLAFPTYLNVYGRCQRGSSGLVLPLG